MPIVVAMRLLMTAFDKAIDKNVGHEFLSILLNDANDKRLFLSRFRHGVHVIGKARVATGIGGLDAPADL